MIQAVVTAMTFQKSARTNPVGQTSNVVTQTYIGEINIGMSKDYIDVPKYVEKAIYCSLWRRMGISFAMSWWIRGNKGGQFFTSITIPARNKRGKKI